MFGRLPTSAYCFWTSKSVSPWLLLSAAFRQGTRKPSKLEFGNPRSAPPQSLSTRRGLQTGSSLTLPAFSDRNHLKSVAVQYTSWIWVSNKYANLVIHSSGYKRLESSSSQKSQQWTTESHGVGSWRGGSAYFSKHSQALVLKIMNTHISHVFDGLTEPRRTTWQSSPVKSIEKTIIRIHWIYVKISSQFSLTYDFSPPEI